MLIPPGQPLIVSPSCTICAKDMTRDCPKTISRNFGPSQTPLSHAILKHSHIRKITESHYSHALELPSPSRCLIQFLYCTHCGKLIVTIFNPAVRPGISISRPEVAKVPCDRRSKGFMNHRRPIFAAVGRHGCLWAKPTRFSKSHFPPETGRMVTLGKLQQIPFQMQFLIIIFVP